jgi:hypothetical protein
MRRMRSPSRRLRTRCLAAGITGCSPADRRSAPPPAQLAAELALRFALARRSLEGKATSTGVALMVGSLVCLLFFLLAFWTRVEAQEIIVNGVILQKVHADLKITIDIIEFRQDDEPIVRLTTGKKHYELALISPTPIPVFDAELPLASPYPSQFTVSVEDAREFRGCLVKGLSSSGEPSSRQFSYALACEDLSRLSFPYPTGN